MPLTRKHRELHTPEADQLRDICAAEADRRTIQFGRPPRPFLPGWTYLGGEWRISYVWFMEVKGMPENHGFRVALKGSRCAVEAWSPYGRITYARNNMPNARQLTRALDAVLGQYIDVSAVGLQGTMTAGQASAFLEDFTRQEHSELSSEELVAIETVRAALHRFLI